MPVIFRTDGAWGSGKGSNLAPAEVDGNFYDIDTRVTSIEDNPVEPIAPIAINIEGSAFTMGLSNGDTLGPITLTMPMPTWRGAWNATVAYAELDFFTSPDNGLGAVMIPHTSAATFDWGALDPGGTGLPVYRQLIGGSGTTSGIADLVDVALGTQVDNDMLVWDGPASLWRNQAPPAVNIILPAFGGSTGSAAGLKGLVPAPAAGDATAGKVLGAGGGWIVPPGGPGTGSLAGLADVAIVSPLNLSLLQYSSVDGKWHNQTLATLGAGTVTHVDTGAGLIGGPITGTGSISLEPIPTLDVLANVTGASAPAAGVSLSTLLDAVLGTARGSVMWRSATGWVALTAGTAGQFLRTGGTGADVTWGTPAGSGTVTQVNSGTGLTGGPITASGTLSLATVSDSQVLANISGGVAAPSGTTLTLLLDHALGATQGMIVYRGAASWSALAPGTSGAVLTSGGAAANPSWVTGSGSGTVTNVATGTGLIGGPITGTGTISFATVANQTLLANISGSTAAPTPSTMSAIMDAVFASARGSVVYRGAAGWAALAPGTAGNVLTTGGASADPSWAAAAGASISIGDTPPGSPTAGAMWWDSVDGQLYLSFNDGTSTQWVPASNQPGPPGTSIPLPVAIASGGTGATTAAAALTALGGATSASVSTADNLRVLKAGDVMTGGLSISAGGWSTVIINSTAGTGNTLRGQHGGATRWDLFLGNSVAESGSNAGGDFQLDRYADNGSTWLGAAMGISRATGAFTLNGSVAVTGQNVNIINSSAPMLAIGNTAGSPTYFGIANSSFQLQFQLLNSSLAYVGLLGNFDTSGNFTIVGGTAVKAGGGSWTAPSSVELKTDVVAYDRGLADVIQLNPVLYSYNGKGGLPAGGERYAGLTAEDVAPVMPEMIVPLTLGRAPEVEGEPSPPPIETLGIDTGPLIMALVNAVKELSAKVETLEAKP